MYMAYTAEQSGALQHVGLIYVASVIAAFRALVRAEPAEPESLDERARCVAAAILPLIELLAARGMIDTLPVMDWLWKGGAFARSPKCAGIKVIVYTRQPQSSYTLCMPFARSPACEHVAGIVDALQDAMRSSSWAVRSAAVDVLLELLPHLWRAGRISEAAFLAPLRGPERLASFGKAALQKGAQLYAGSLADLRCLHVAAAHITSAVNGMPACHAWASVLDMLHW